ncbi:MAG: YraN family protein [bacterium]|nr:YraN family protein [bacterium]
MFVAKSIRFISKMSQNSQIGIIGEKSAAYFIVKRGFNILGTNYRKPYGEIDIVAEKDRVIRFIEVKTSRYYPNSAFTPEIRVNARKVRNLKKLCETFLREKRASLDQPWQIDVISVILDGSAVRGINFFENAVFERKY